MDIHSVCLRDSYCNYYFCKLQTHKENNGYNRRNAECGGFKENLQRDNSTRHLNIRLWRQNLPIAEITSMSAQNVEARKTK